MRVQGPPSVLPGISPSRGEIGSGSAIVPIIVGVSAPPFTLPIFPVEGEMAGSQEGGL
jgi:hypothetical protein